MFLLELYHLSNAMIISIFSAMSLSALFWLFYFINKLSNNVRIRRNLLKRNIDLDLVERLNYVNNSIGKDSFLIFILIVEVISPIFISGIVFDNFNTVTGTLPQYDCHILTNGTYMGNLFRNQFGFIFEGFRQGFLTVHPRLYLISLEYIILIYKGTKNKRKCLHFILCVTILQTVSVVILASIPQTYIIGSTLSVLFLVINSFSIICSSKRLYRQLNWYLQDLSLICTTLAVQEYRRIKLVTQLFKRVWIIFTVLLFILIFGFVVFTVGCIWVEWFFLLRCSKINPYAMGITVSDKLERTFQLISLVSREILGICASLFYSGIVGISFITGIRMLVRIRRRTVPKINNRPLLNPLIKN